MAAPEVAAATAMMGLTPRFEAGEAFAARIRREREVFGAVVRRIGAGWSSNATALTDRRYVEVPGSTTRDRANPCRY